MKTKHTEAYLARRKRMRDNRKHRARLERISEFGRLMLARKAAKNA